MSFRELMGYSLLFCLWSLLLSATGLALLSMANLAKDAFKRLTIR